MLRSFPLLLLLPAIAFAQTEEVVKKLDAKLDAERAAQRNEDVEILRRLLNKAVGLPDKVHITVESATRLNPNDQVPPFSVMTPEYQEVWSRKFEEWAARNLLQSGATKVTAPVGPFDGVYLPGAGVVYTLHVPAGVPRTLHGDRIGLNSSCSTCHQPQVHITHTMPVSVSTCTTCHSDMPKSPVLLSDWDRTKMDVRGEKPKEPVAKPKGDKPAPAVCEPGGLQNLIVGVLATNAKNVRHLGEQERITVVVTFDDLSVGSKPTVWNIDPSRATDDVDVFHNPALSNEPLPGRNVKPAGKPGFTPDEVKSLSLGDLHMKQGKYKEACDAYATALARFTDKEFKVGLLTNMTAEQRKQHADELQKGVRDVMKNYAKALVLADQPEKAKLALDLATGFIVLEVTPTTVPASSTAPAKLILTVSKSDIDTAKDTAAFKKAMKAERMNFPAEGKK